MAAILRSALRKTVHHAFSMEGTHSVRHPQLRQRLLHTGDNVNCTRTADASHAVSSLKSDEIDTIAKKINGIARKAALVEYIQRTLKEGKSSVVPPLLFSAFLFVAGYRIGFYNVVDTEYQE